MRASFMMISAKPSRCRMPREKVPTFFSATSARPTRASAAPMRSLRMRLGNAHQPRRVVQIIGRGHVVVEADRVRQIADQALDRERLAHRVMPEYASLPGADVAQAEQHQNRGGLAGAVGAEQAEDFARADIEVDAIDGDRRAIALGEAFGLDDRGDAHRRPKRTTAPTMMSSAAPMMPTPATPHMVEVVTVTRKFAVPFSPLVDAESVLT